MGTVFSVRDLHFRYPASGEDTIKGITFDVHEGEIFGLLGPSGAGKSTTQKILVKLLDGYRGSVRYFGRDLREIDNSYYEEIGVGFEMPVHFTRLTTATVPGLVVQVYRFSRRCIFPRLNAFFYSLSVENEDDRHGKSQCSHGINNSMLLDEYR